MAEENGVASNFIWALAFIIIVAILAGVFYYSGFMGGARKQKIDINVETPSTR